ncbi:MAG: hypothetical protein PHI06_01495 [Desulfobulbaceae bacterium]|nr:hypothetical protein [Desulfobulbaceae bacterium]
MERLGNMYRKAAESAKKNQEISRLKKEWMILLGWGKKENGIC